MSRELQSHDTSNTQVPQTAQPLEIERKFLIERPDENVLADWPGAYSFEIEQIYLPPDDSGQSGRIRRRTGQGGSEYFYTVKQRLTDMTRVETERHITPEEYHEYELAAMASVAPSHSGESLARICKTRWCLPFAGHVIEIDIYPFWRRRAVAEIELAEESEQFSLPPVLTVIREVTGVRELLNRDMAVFIQNTGRPPREPD